MIAANFNRSHTGAGVSLTPHCPHRKAVTGIAARQFGQFSTGTSIGYGVFFFLVKPDFFSDFRTKPMAP